MAVAVSTEEALTNRVSPVDESDFRFCAAPASGSRAVGYLFDGAGRGLVLGGANAGAVRIRYVANGADSVLLDDAARGTQEAITTIRFEGPDGRSGTSTIHGTLTCERRTVGADAAGPTRRDGGSATVAAGVVADGRPARV